MGSATVVAADSPAGLVVPPQLKSHPYGTVLLTLTNQLLPDEKLAQTPSQLDGLESDVETDLRIYGCELIQTAGRLLKLPQVAMATGQVLLQRFYYSKSLVRHPIEQTSMACICLASKIEEAPRRVRDVINVFTHIRQVNFNKAIRPVILDQNYIQLKNLVIKAERRVLKELGFCVHIKHPHKIIVLYLQVLGYEKNQKLMQYSWNYMNDSLRTDVFVRYQPEAVACACIWLTARKLKLPLPKQPLWHTIFGVTDRQIHDIALRILKLYNRTRINIEQLEKRVEDLCKRYQDARIKARTIDGAPDSANSPSSMDQQKNAAAHNAWGGFISRSGSHIAPPPVTTAPSSSTMGTTTNLGGTTTTTTNRGDRKRNNNNNNNTITSPISKKRSKKHKYHHRHHHHHHHHHRHRPHDRSRSPHTPNHHHQQLRSGAPKNHEKRRSYTRSLTPPSSKLNESRKSAQRKRSTSVSPSGGGRHHHHHHHQQQYSFNESKKDGGKRILKDYKRRSKSKDRRR